MKSILLQSAVIVIRCSQAGRHRVVSAVKQKKKKKTLQRFSRFGKIKHYSRYWATCDRKLKATGRRVCGLMVEISVCLSWSSVVLLCYLSRSDDETRTNLISVLLPSAHAFVFISDLLKPKLPITAISPNPLTAVYQPPTDSNSAEQAGLGTPTLKMLTFRCDQPNHQGLWPKTPCTSPAPTYIRLD